MEDGGFDLSDTAYVCFRLCGSVFLSQKNVVLTAETHGRNHNREVSYDTFEDYGRNLY
jgi:hypothetical protein